jgi:cytoskeletal protein RodZ
MSRLHSAVEEQFREEAPFNVEEEEEELVDDALLSEDESSSHYAEQEYHRRRRHHHPSLWQLFFLVLLVVGLIVWLVCWMKSRARKQRQPQLSEWDKYLALSQSNATYNNSNSNSNNNNNNNNSNNDEGSSSADSSSAGSVGCVTGICPKFLRRQPVEEETVAAEVVSPTSRYHNSYSRLASPSKLSCLDSDTNNLQPYSLN